MQELTSMSRHPEMLRVNHQIYFEAFPVFYSGLGVVVPSKGIWRYKPLEGDTQAYYYGEIEEDESFEVIYDPPLTDGVTKPQGSAKFSKVLLTVKFNRMLPVGWRYDEETGKIPVAWHQQLTDAFQTSSIIEDFVGLLAGCSWVDHVDIDLAVLVDFDTDQQSLGCGSPVEDLEKPHWIERRKIWHKGDIQVAGILLSSGVLNPLQRLSNVRSWCIEFTLEDVHEEPPSWHQRMTLDLGDTIEPKR